jgi:hypothetical protein
MLGILCTSYFCPDKTGRQVSLCSVPLNLGAIFKLNRSSILRPRIPGDRLIVIIEQGVIAIAAFDALNKTIDSIAKM